ncbi:MAG TPA: ABC transporter ATP-binding protein [Bryobacteraceae bacterium]|nr:ABC transporter ATP-binding protein [Bryobacteraceae bacterium]
MQEEVLGKAYDARLMRRLVRYLWPYRTAVAVSAVFLMLGSVANVAGPLLTKLALDRYLVPPDHAGPSVLEGWLSPWLAQDVTTGLVQITVLYLAMLLAGFVCEFVEAFLMQRTGQFAMFDLRRELMEHLQVLDLSYYDRNPVGRMITRVTTDVDALNELWSSGMVTVMGDFMAVAFVIFAMLRLSPMLTAIMLAVMPLVVLATARFRNQVQDGYRRIRVAVAAINAYLQEHLTGMAVVQLFNREARSREEFDAVNRAHLEAFKDTITAYGWFYPVAEILAMLALALVLSAGGVRIRTGALSLGVLVAFFQYGQRIFRPIQDLSEKYNILQSAMAASERIFKLLDTAPRVVSPVSPRPFPEGPAAVEFDHVWFAYKDEDWVLRDVSFRIEPGETIAVVGHTGAGKTTLTNLLLRFYDIQRGSIRIGGVDIREFALDDLRGHFGVVLQDPHLFTGTVETNIRLGTAWIEDRDLESAAAQVNLLEFIRELPEGFGHPVRERGVGFSTGQKQLISFARALAHNPRFLILDEATSSVDTETEFRVREALARLVEGRTSLVIAHRLSTIQRADRILVMHKGQLWESGTHQELLALHGIYWKLYQLQYKDQEVTDGGISKPSAVGSSEVSGRPVLVPASSQPGRAEHVDR